MKTRSLFIIFLIFCLAPFAHAWILAIKDGKIANIAIFDGDPLQPLTRVSDVLIEGRRIPMKSYQTELYEKYR